MIATEIENFRVVVFDHLQDSVEKAGMFSFPGTWFFELPAVDNISVEDEIFAGVLFQKTGYFLGFGTFSAQVNVRNNDGFEVGFQSVGFNGKIDCPL